MNSNHPDNDHQPQILAPAGDKEAFLAALAARADAIYCGLKMIYGFLCMRISVAGNYPPIVEIPNRKMILQKDGAWCYRKMRCFFHYFAPELCDDLRENCFQHNCLIYYIKYIEGSCRARKG